MSANRARRRHPDREPASEPRITITVPGAKVPPRPYPPGTHPGQDRITVICPDVRGIPLDGTAGERWLEEHPPPVLAEEVTRDEFMSRMAGSEVVAQVNADPRNRVVALMEADAILRWLGIAS